MSLLSSASHTSLSIFCFRPRRYLSPTSAIIAQYNALDTSTTWIGCDRCDGCWNRLRTLARIHTPIQSVCLSASRRCACLPQPRPHQPHPRRVQEGPRSQLLRSHHSCSASSRSQIKHSDHIQPSLPCYKCPRFQSR